MGVRTPWFVGLALSHLACSVEVDALPWPALGDGHAGILALEIGEDGDFDQLPLIVAFDPAEVAAEGRWPASLGASFEGTGRVTVLEYELGTSLADLGVKPGPLRPGNGPALIQGQPILQQLVIESGRFEAWEKIERLPAGGPLAGFRFEIEQPRCACLTGRRLETGTSSAAAVALLRMGVGRVIVGTVEGRLYWVREDRLEDFTPLALTPFGPPDARAKVLGGGVSLGERSFVLTDRAGGFFRFELDVRDRVSSVERIAQWPSPKRFRWMAHDAPWIYALDVDGSFGRVDMNTGLSEELHLFDQFNASLAVGSVVSKGPGGELVVTSARSAELGRVRGGVFSLDPRLMSPISLASATYHPDFGLFVGAASRGIIHRERADGSWASCDSQLGSSIGVMTPFSDGILAGTTVGFVEQYSMRDGWCPKLQTAFSTVRYMASYDDEGRQFVMAGPRNEEASTDPEVVTFVELDAPEACDLIRNPGREAKPTCALSGL